MPITSPYRRTVRPFADGNYTEGGRSRYILHPKFAQSPDKYVRAFLLLLKDVRELFDYVEPADKNLDTYSYRIHSLLLRASVEVEANCKAILKENGYRKTGNMNMNDYKKINESHHLSSYQVMIPYWDGTKNLRSPFLNWAKGGSLSWYEAYNASKHDRHAEFTEATLRNLLDATCGLLVLLSAQFETQDFSPSSTLLALDHGPPDGMISSIGGFFRIKFPDDWPDELRYEFDWQLLKEETDPFQEIDYSKIT